ncbi:MAG TPA: alcohol dehydrogenase catalytic domain-containing protein [Streptomyces sp.]|nr:alcohol dehydrogenase catalytic domain-containing protein [Streptomyces sp.]HET6358898.1 alcohol dehydrogenase catalytic domain-containing protein [Streptomyces sp.]
MKAAVITTPGTVELATVDDPAPGPREVVVQVAACGLCGTDLHILQGEHADDAIRATIEPCRIYNQEVTITGSMAVLHSFERAADLFAAGVIDPDVFISDRLPLAAFPDAIARFQTGIGPKIQIQPGRATA